MMDFRFSDEQRVLQAAVRELLEKECPPEQVRAMAAHETGRSPERWKRLAHMGVLGLLAPADHGGAGGNEIDLVLALEETGHAALPEPVVEHAAVAVPLLRDFAPPEIASAWLGSAAAGESIVTAGFDDVPHVSDAHVADLLLLQHGDEVHAVPRDRVEIDARPTLDGCRRLFAVSWERGQDTLVAAGAAGRRAMEEAFDRGALGVSAQLLGMGSRMVEMAAQHAKDRHQFGKPIGAFQAVKHPLANALLGLEFARPAVYRAAWSMATGADTRSRDASMAKALASDAARRAARIALQVHGAIGYTHEHDLHLWLARTWALAAAWGDAARHRARVFDTLDERGQSGGRSVLL